MPGYKTTSCPFKTGDEITELVSGCHKSWVRVEAEIRHSTKMSFAVNVLKEFVWQSGKTPGMLHVVSRQDPKRKGPKLGFSTYNMF